MILDLPSHFSSSFPRVFTHGSSSVWLGQWEHNRPCRDIVSGQSAFGLLKCRHQLPDECNLSEVKRLSNVLLMEILQFTVINLCLWQNWATMWIWHLHIFVNIGIRKLYSHNVNITNADAIYFQNIFAVKLFMEFIYKKVTSATSKTQTWASCFHCLYLLSVRGQLKSKYKTPLSLFMEMTLCGIAVFGPEWKQPCVNVEHTCWKIIKISNFFFFWCRAPLDSAAC